MDDSMESSQRPMWDALKTSINELVNKVTVSNLTGVAAELLTENLIWGRGLFCSAILESAVGSHTLAPVFAALVAAINSKYPDVGYLLIKRVVDKLKIAIKRNDKHLLVPLVKLLAHLILQGVVHELLALEFLFVLLQDPTGESIKAAVLLVQQCSSAVGEYSPRGLDEIYQSFRELVLEGNMNEHIPCLIDGLFAIGISKLKGYPAVCPEPDIVDLDDQVTHEISLCNDNDPEMYLDLFHPDSQVLMNDEERYKLLKAIVLREDEGDSDEDETESDLVNLRRTIFLTLMSGTDYEDAGQKLINLPLQSNQEMELCNMLLDCSSHQKTCNRYFTLVAQRLCRLNDVYRENFKNCFVLQYSNVHSLGTNKLHNVAKFFAHLLSSDSLTWHILVYIRLTEEDMTPSSLVFIKILFQELAEELGVPLVKKRLNDPALQGSLDSIFPKDNLKNLQFSINFFASIGLEGLTKNLREYLKNMEKQNQVSHSDEETQSSASSVPKN
ncbi:hypothetical protein ACH5RR_018683 [Cinchona calisaya]|uniref:MI domain-containing protein n=1 Tax=Cinchona calisaya TaxID=153742 RepID=A0ABD2ZN20_9GENT